MTKEALKLALEALEAGDWYINQLEMIVYSVDDDGTHENRAKVQKAVTAIKEYLAQREPAKYSDYEPDGVHHNKPEHDTVQRLSALVRAQQITIDKLEAQLEQEPFQPDWANFEEGRKVGRAEALEDGQKPVGKWIGKKVEWTDNPYKFSQGQPIYTSPPQRKPLTDDARGHLVIEYLGPNALLHKPMSVFDAFHMGIDAAEAARDIKENT